MRFKVTLVREDDEGKAGLMRFARRAAEALQAEGARFVALDDAADNAVELTFEGEP